MTVQVEVIGVSLVSYVSKDKVPVNGWRVCFASDVLKPKDGEGKFCAVEFFRSSQVEGAPRVGPAEAEFALMHNGHKWESLTFKGAPRT